MHTVIQKFRVSFFYLLLLLRKDALNGLKFLKNIYIYIYIYAFSRRFYPKRLEYIQVIIFFVSMCVPWESNPQPLRCYRNALTTEPQEHVHIYIYICVCVCVCVTLDHNTSLKTLGYICSNSQKYIVWVKIIDFSFMQKT